MECIKWSQTSNKPPQNGFSKDTYTVPNKIGAKMSSNVSFVALTECLR